MFTIGMLMGLDFPGLQIFDHLRRVRQDQISRELTTLVYNDDFIGGSSTV